MFLICQLLEDMVDFLYVKEPGSINCLVWTFSSYFLALVLELVEWTSDSLVIMFFLFFIYLSCFFSVVWNGWKLFVKLTLCICLELVNFSFLRYILLIFIKVINWWNSVFHSSELELFCCSRIVLWCCLMRIDFTFVIIFMEDSCLYPFVIEAIFRKKKKVSKFWAMLYILQLGVNGAAIFYSKFYGLTLLKYINFY